MGIKERHFAPLERVTLEQLVPQDTFYRQGERTLDLSFVRDLVARSVRKPRPPSWRGSTAHPVDVERAGTLLRSGAVIGGGAMFVAVLAQILDMLLDLLTVRWRSAATKDREILVLRRDPARTAAHAGSCPSAVALLRN